MSGLCVPDAIEPIAGWRYWRYDAHSRRLRSLAGPHVEWRPGKALRAQCRFGSVARDDWRFQLVTGYPARFHDSPGEGCTCGVYAARDLTQLRRHGLLGMRRTVIGEVSLWGKVIPARRGYRAEYAYPSRLMVLERLVERYPGVLEALEGYGVPVEAVGHGRSLSSSRNAVAGAAP